MNRKIIQIAVNICQDEKPMESLYALCDDGTLWENTYTWSDNHWNGWKKIPPVPGQEKLSSSTSSLVRESEGHPYLRSL